MNKYRKFIRILEEEYEPFSYSGRGMLGRECIALEVDELSDAFEVVHELGRQDIELPITRWDNLGLRYVIYWPQVEYSKERLLA